MSTSTPTPNVLRRLARLWALPLCCLCLLLWPAAGLAQGGSTSLWQTYTVNDGLLSSNVSAVFLAQDGALWFGAENGVSRFRDGVWQSLTAKDGLPAGRVRTIQQTADGAIWFGGETGGLARRTADGVCCQTWTTAHGLASNDVRAILPDGDQAVWVGTAAGLMRLEAGRLTRVDALAGKPIWTLARGADGVIWAATAGQGVWSRGRDGNWRALESSPLVSGQVFALWAENGRLWVGTENGLAYYAHGVWTRQPLQENDTGVWVFAILGDADGGLWVGTSAGCFWDARQPGWPVAVLRARAGLAGDYVRGMTFDRSGALWLATSAGVSRYAGAIWKTVRYEPLAEQRINALLTDRSGRTWVGTERNGLALWDGARWSHFTRASGLPDNRILALLEDDRGRIWVGAGTGVGYWTTAGGWRFIGPADGLVGVPVTAIAQDSAGRLWFGSFMGANRWSETGGMEPVSELAGKRINAILRSRDAALWFGAHNDGLFRYAEGRWQSIATTKDAPAFKSVTLNGIAQDRDGALWVGTYDQGLWRYAAGQWQSVDSGLASSLVLAVSYFGDSLWVGSAGGLTRTDGRSTQLYTGSVLPNAQVYAVAPGKDGAVWIGAASGLVRYTPDKVTPWVKVASVNLLEPREGIVSLADGDLRAVRLAAGDASGSLNDIVFLVQLEGVDERPRIYADPLIAYSDVQLQPGKYTLRAWARDAAFNYSAPAEATIVVAPPQRHVVLPGGRRVPADSFYPILALSILALGGLAAAGGAEWRSRARERRRRGEETMRQREALARHFNPYISGEPVREPEMFFARDELLRKILNALHQNSIMIHGERRMGKTSLLYQLAQQLRQAEDPEWVFVPVSVDLEGTAQDRFFYLLMEATWSVLRAFLTEAPPDLRFSRESPAEYTDRDFAADLRLLLDALKAVVAPRNVRVILLMDEMDVINGYETLVQQQLRRIFMSPLAQNLGAVVAGVQISKAWDRMESPWYNLFNEIALDPFNAEQAAQLLMEPVAGVYEWDSAALEFVVAHAQGRPHRLQQYGLEAVNHMLAEGRVRITEADVRAAHETIERARTE